MIAPHVYLSLPLTSAFLSSFFWLFLQCVSRLVTCSYHCLILVGGFSTSINFLLVTLFILLLNSFTNAFSSYLLSLATLLNSWINSFIVFPLYLIFLSSANLTDSSSPLPNFFFIFIKNSLTNSNFTFSNSKSSNRFSFHTSADSLYTCDNTYWICFFTPTSLILILKYNLYTIINSTILLASPLNISSLAISIWDHVLDSSTLPFPTIIGYSAAIFSCYILICSKSWLTLN